MTSMKPEMLKEWDRKLIVENPEEPDRSLLAGTGLDIYEIYSVYRSADEIWENFRYWFDWLSEEQLRAAMGYAYAHLPVMEARWKEDDELPARLEQLWRDYPQLKPPHLK